MFARVTRLASLAARVQCGSSARVAAVPTAVRSSVAARRFTAATARLTAKQAGTGALATEPTQEVGFGADIDAAMAQLPPKEHAKERVDALRAIAKMYMSRAQFAEARQQLLEALQLQETIYKNDVNPVAFLDLLRVLTDVVACIRMGGVNPSDLSGLDTVSKFYEDSRSQLLAVGHQQSVLEHPMVYTFVCFVAGAYIDGEAFTKAKDLLAKHLLFDVDTTSPSSASGAYDLKDLRLASGLNFTGIALFSDHSACGGDGHSHHHHTHDHSAAGEAWHRALTYTAPFTRMLLDSRPVGRLDHTDQLMLQATSVILDNLAQAAMSVGKLDEAIAFSRADVANLQAAYLPFDSRLIAGQAQCLKTLLETQKMDDAEIMCEEMLSAFPRPTPGVDTSIPVVPEEVSLETSRIYDELSNVMYQFQNLDYAEKFLQISHTILRARLVDENGRPVTVHPSLARAENGLGLLQLQMKDYANAEAHLQRGLDMKLQLAAQGHLQQAADGSSGVRADDGTAEFYHNLALAQMGLQKDVEAEASFVAARAKYTARFTAEDGTVNLVHASYAGLCSQMAALHRARKNDAQALVLSKEALAIKTQLFAPHSPQLVADLYMTANLHANALGQYAEAIPLFQQLVSILEKPQGGRPPNAASLGATLHWLALAYDRVTPRDPALAAENWRKAIVQLEKSMGVREVLPLQKELRRVVAELDLHDEVKQIDDKIATNEQTLAQQAAAQAAAAAAAAPIDPNEQAAPFTTA